MLNESIIFSLHMLSLRAKLPRVHGQDPLSISLSHNLLLSHWSHEKQNSVEVHRFGDEAGEGSVSDPRKSLGKIIVFTPKICLQSR